MSNACNQQEEERTVFGEFAAICPLRLRPETATSGKPPCPDILCELETGERLAFELVSCADTTVHTKNIAVTKTETDERKLECALMEQYTTAMCKGQVSNPEQFHYQTIKVQFTEGSSFKQCREAIPQVIGVLCEDGSLDQKIDLKRIESIQCRSWKRQGGPYAGPMFDVGSALQVETCVVEQVKKKFAKKYDSTYPIHLVAWSDTASAEELEMLGINTALVELFRSDGKGPFERIWVLGRSRSSIAFDSDSYAI